MKEEITMENPGQEISGSDSPGFRLHFDTRPWSNEQKNALVTAVEFLGKAGVTFDIGSCPETPDGGGETDWYFDWSLKGATVA